VKISREQALLGREEAMRVKRVEAEGTEKKVEIKKRLADFRQVRVMFISSIQFISSTCLHATQYFLCH
jgi:hypothetical protein